MMKTRDLLLLGLLSGWICILDGKAWRAQAAAAEVSQEETESADVAQQSLAALKALGVKAYYDGYQGRTIIELKDSDITEDILGHVSNLRHLIIDVKVPGTNFQRLDGLPNLKSLNVAGASITDDDLQAINGVSSVNALILDRARITDAGLAGLHGLTGLRTLSLRRTQITDKGAGGSWANAQSGGIASR